MSFERQMTLPDQLQKRLIELRYLKQIHESQKNASLNQLSVHVRTRVLLVNQIIELRKNKVDVVSSSVLDEKKLSAAILQEDVEIAKLKQSIFAHTNDIRNIIKEVVLTEDKVDELPDQFFHSSSSSNLVFDISLAKKRKEFAFLSLPNDVYKQTNKKIREIQEKKIVSEEKVAREINPQEENIEIKAEAKPVSTVDSSKNAIISTSPQSFFSSSGEQSQYQTGRGKGNAEVHYNKALEIFEKNILITNDNFKKVLSFYNNAIHHMTIAIDMYRAGNQHKSKQGTVNALAIKLEETADFLIDQISFISQNISYDKAAKINYLKMAGSFYQKAIMLRESIHEDCKFSLYLSPLFVYYQLAHFYTFNVEYQMRLIRNHIKHHSMDVLADTLATEDQKIEFQEYVDFVSENKQPKSNNAIVQSQRRL